MANVTVDVNNNLVLNLTPDERGTYDALPAGQLAEFVTLWLENQFKISWKSRVDALSHEQKKIVVGYLQDVAAEVISAPIAEEAIPAPPQ